MEKLRACQKRMEFQTERRLVPKNVTALLDRLQNVDLITGVPLTKPCKANSFRLRF